MIRFYLCADCAYVMASRMQAIDHHNTLGHDAEQVTLHRRRRRATGGFETQWASDWTKEKT